MTRKVLIAASLVASFWGFPALDAQCVLNVATGFDQAADAVIFEGDPDDDYTVDDGFGALPALTGGAGNGFPIPPWIENDEGSLWISPSLDSISPPGDYIYEIRFDVPVGVDASSLTLMGRWAADDHGADIFINGSSTGITGEGFVAWTELPADAGLGLFVDGENTIQLVVENGGVDPNPAGVRVDACVGLPEPEERGLGVSTGFDDQNVVTLGDGVADDDYTVTGPPGSGINGTAAVTVVDDGFPIPPWFPNSVNSRWIGLDDPDSTGPAGEYIYRTEIDLPPGFDVSRALFRGSFGADDRLQDILVNGTPTGVSGGGLESLTPVPVDAGMGLFVQGRNSVDFVVVNDGDGTTGLRVDGEIILGPEPCAAAVSAFSLDTGFDDEAGTTIASGLDDDNYILLGPPGSGVGPTCAHVIPDDVYPVAPAGPWVASSEQSKWIGLAEASTSGPPGIYTYRISLEIPESIEADTLRIVGSWSSDNAAIEVLINGVSSAIGGSGDFTTLVPFPEGAGLGLFQSGENMVEFLIENAAPGVNPTGLRVEAIVGTGTPDPNNLSSGIGARGVGILPAGSEDSRYIVTGPAGSGIESQTAVVISTLGPGWAENSEGSRWIGLDGGSSEGPAGTYTYEVVYETPPRFNPERLGLEGPLAADGRLLDVVLNGFSLGFAVEGPGSLTSLPAAAGKGFFQRGTNTLGFLVENEAQGPTGLQVAVFVNETVMPNPLDISTGFDQGNGVTLGDAAFDDDYTVTDPLFITEDAVVTAEIDRPPTWILSTANSRWIGLAGGSAVDSGVYRFQTSVTLTLEEAQRARLVGAWAADDFGQDVLINEVSSGLATQGGFTALTDFPDDAGLGLFQEGENIIEFVVENHGEGLNPSGLRVDAVVDVGETRPKDLFVRGDVDSSGAINITDAIVLLNWLFLGGKVPSCTDAADVNDEGTNAPNITDGIFLLTWLFQGGAEPPPPTPSNPNYSIPADCGVDATDDGMTCDSFVPCE